MATFKEVRKRNKQLSQRVAKSTGVDETLAMNVILYAKNLTSPQYPDYIEKFVFIAQMWTRFGMTSKFLIEIIFELLRAKEYSAVMLEDYVNLICIFLTDDTKPKIAYVFRCYDLKRDGYLDQKGVQTMLRTTLYTSSDDIDSNDHIKELMDLVMMKIDKNNDGVITLEEFNVYAREDILCIELLGTVLPLEKYVKSFKQLVQGKLPHSVTLFFLDERRICLNGPLIPQPDGNLYPVHLETPL